MRFISLVRYLQQSHGFSRRHAMVGARVALGVDSLDALKNVGHYWEGRVQREVFIPTFRGNDFTEIRTAASHADSFI